MSQKENQCGPLEDYNKNKAIEPHDLLRSLIEKRNTFLEQILKELNVDLPLLSGLLGKRDIQGDFSYSPELTKVQEFASEERISNGDKSLEDHHILLAIARWEETKGGGLLSWMGGNYVHTQKVVRFLRDSYPGSDWGGPGLLILDKPK